MTPLRTLLAGQGGRQFGSVTPILVSFPPQPFLSAGGLSYRASPAQKTIVDQHVLNQISRYAQRNGVSEAQVRATIESTLNDLVKNIPISRRQDYADFAAIQSSGRFKSQFETKASHGFFGPPLRARAEEKGLGYPLNIIPIERPVYGYFNVSQSPSLVDNYGDLEFVFKDAVRSRATFTVGDSLANFLHDRLYGTPLNTPELGAADTFVEALMEYARTGDKRRLVYNVGLC